MKRPPSRLELELRATLRSARVEELQSGVFALELELGGLSDALDTHLAGQGLPDCESTALNSLNRHGRSLEGGPFEWVGGAVVDELLEPLRREHLAEAVPAPLDADYSYLIEYGERGDPDLPLHVDASHLTFNLCLGDSFEGGDLVLEGPRCEAHRESPPDAFELRSLEHAPGRAYVHLGAQRHRVSPIEEGRRRNLIVWARNDATSATLGGNGPCAAWCAAHRPDGGAPRGRSTTQPST